MSLNASPAAEERLLYAVLSVACPDDARAAWVRWKSTYDLDHLGSGASALVPQLAVRLAELGVDDPIQRALRRMGRVSSIRNQILAQHARAHLEALGEYGVTACLFGGLAAALTAHARVGDRVTYRAALLVPPDGGAIAAAVAGELGCTPRAQIDDGRILRYGVPMGADLCLDIHTAPLPRRRYEAAVYSLSRRTQIAMLAGQPIRCLGPRRQLLLALATPTPIPPAERVGRRLDAVALASAANEADWAWVVEQAARHDLLLPVREAAKALLGDARVDGWPNPSRRELLDRRISTWRGPGASVSRLAAKGIDAWRDGQAEGISGIARALLRATKTRGGEGAH